MRVIAGKARRTQLVTPEGLNTRPTTDRIKETLFNMINNELYDCRFLDLFSGSGGIGIEALSRGAVFCTFVENDREAVRCIQQNLKKTKMEEQADIIKTDAVLAVKGLQEKGEKPYDFIFMDPPYNRLYERDVLTALKCTDLVDEYTTIIIEASLDTDTEYIGELGFYIDKIKEYKTNKHIFVSKKILGDEDIMSKAIYPGSFDPVTLGHIDVITRASKIFDEIIVGVLINSSKSPLFSIDERVNMLKEVCGRLENVRVISFDGFSVDFAKEQNANVIIRGLRAITDFEYELQMAQTNRVLNPQIDTLFLTTSIDYSYLSSSIVKEVASLGGDISRFVPEPIIKKVYDRYKTYGKDIKNE